MADSLFPVPWPEAIAGMLTIAVIERAIERQRLANSLLLHGENLATLATVAHGIADRLLNDPRHPSQYFAPKHHPDFFALRPEGKMYQISAEAMRGLIDRIHVSPRVSIRKVAVIYEADHMHAAVGNIFLKTLEEPPASTTILLLTTRPHSLLATIYSRCLHFRFTDAGYEALSDATETAREAWRRLRADYSNWLARLGGGLSDKKVTADQVMSIYGFVTRFSAVLAAITGQIWKQQKGELLDDLRADQVDAIQSGISNGMRLKLFAEIEQVTHSYARERLVAGDEIARRALIASIEQLEYNISMLHLNLNEAAALENFLLASLSIWSQH